MALKVLTVPGDDVEHREASRIRMQREARAMARIAHSGVATIYDVGDAGDGMYIAMEYIEGVTLYRWAAQGPDIDARIEISPKWPAPSRLYTARASCTGTSSPQT